MVLSLMSVMDSIFISLDYIKLIKIMQMIIIHKINHNSTEGILANTHKIIHFRSTQSVDFRL